MQFDGKETWAFTVTLGEHLVERFQIYLDGNQEQMIHPNGTDATSDVPVHGPDPSKDVQGSCWAIDGRAYAFAALPSGTETEQAALEDVSNALQLASPDQGMPGEQYKVKLMVNGQYRLVTWEKIVESGPDDTLVPVVGDLPRGKYYITSSWNDWTYQEMVADDSMPGVYHIEAQLLKNHGEFNIVRNKDWHQVIYPSVMFANEDVRSSILGPDEYGRGYEWLIDGKPGDVFMIDFQRAYENGTVAMQTTWRRLRNEKLSSKQESEARRRPFYVVTSLDNYLGRRKMAWDGERYMCPIEIPSGGSVNFQILEEGDRGKVLHPSMEDAGSKDTYNVMGPTLYGSDLSWKIGKYLEEQGGVYEVQLEVRGQRLFNVVWVRR